MDLYGVCQVATAIATVLTAGISFVVSVVKPHIKRINIAAIGWGSINGGQPFVVITNLCNKSIILERLEFWDNGKKIGGYDFLDDVKSNEKKYVLTPNEIKEIVVPVLDTEEEMKTKNGICFSVSGLDAEERHKIKILLIDVNGKKYRWKKEYSNQYLDEKLFLNGLWGQEE